MARWGRQRKGDRIMEATAERTRGLSDAAESARVRAVKFGTSDLNQWAESLTMSLQAEVTRYMVDGNVDHLHEALVIAEALPGVIVEQIERSQRAF